MSLSDDVASLKVGVHKLAVAIEELAIKKYLQGEIDISKLPWFTPQYVPGDSIKLSSSRLPTATVYSDNNEVIASPTPCFPNSSDNSLGAPKVFDQMPEPNSCSNQLKNVAAHFGGTQTPTAANLNLSCDKDANLTMVVGQLASLNAFEKDIIHGGDSQRYANGVVRVNSQCLTPNFGVDNKLSDVHEHLSDCKLIPKPQLQSAHKVLDELPEPTEQANAGQTTCQLAVINNDNTPIQDDHFTHKQQLFAPLGALNASYFNDLVWNMISEPDCCYRFVFDPGVLLMHKNRDDISAHTKLFEMNVDHDDLSCSMVLEPTCLYQFVFDPGVLFLLSSMAEKDSCLSFFDFKIGWKAKINYKELHSWSNFAFSLESGILELMLGSYFGYFVTRELMLSLSKCWYILNSHSWPHYVMLESSVHVAITKHAVDFDSSWMSVSHYPWNVSGFISLFFTHTLEDKGDFRGEEDTSREYTWEWFNPLTLWSHFSASRTNNGHLFLTFVFDPGILLCQSDLWDALLHSSWCSNPNLGFYMSCLMVCVLDELGNCNTWLPLLSNMSCSRIITMINAFSLGHIRYDSSKLLITSHLQRFWYLTFDRGSCDHSKVLSAHVGVPSLIRAHIISKSAAIIILTSVFIETGDKGILFSTPLKLILSFVFHNMSLSEGNITIAYYYEGWVVSDMYVDGSVRIVLLLNGSSFHLLKENLKVATKCFMKKEVVRLVTIFIFDLGINKPRLVEKRSVAVRCSVGVTINLVFVYAEILVWPKIYSLRQGYEAARWKLLGRVVFVIEKRAYAIEETREKNSARKDPTISSKFSMFMIINSLVFDPGGWKYNISLAESATSKFLQTTEIFLSCYLAQLDLLHSSNCADHEVAILVFYPGGYGNGQKVKKQPEACQYGGGKRLKDKRNEDHWIYVFDPGGY